ncbi:MAG: permease [Planctomycetaceae bacterium]|jgi:uncharacterized membrane protein YraQ (UPF0718 family)|nr:permease [Planctomycetaceae bacterium]
MTFLFTLAVRALQATLDAAPTLLVGLMIAAWLRVVVGPEKLRHIFSGEGTTGLWRASLLAMLAPVCSLGVLPVSRELHRAGVSTAKVMSFTLAAPLLNPITLCYGITTFDLPVFLLVVAVSLVFSFGVGAITARWLDDEDEGARPEAELTVYRSVGLRRMANLAITAARLCAGVVAIDLVICVLVSALAAYFVPADWLVSRMKYTISSAPLTMTAVAWPAYVSPTTGVMQVAAMSKIQLSLGAAIALHLLGVGLNASGVRWILALHGMRRLISLGLVILAMTWTMGYSADALLEHPPGAEEDTHGLDSLAQTRLGADGLITTRAIMHNLALFGTSPANWFAVLLLIVGIVAGLALRVARMDGLPDPASDESSKEELLVAGRDIVLPRSAVMSCSFCGLLAAGVIVLLVYYPPVYELLDEMSSRKADAIVSMRTDESAVAIRSIDALQDAVRKLPVSAALRMEPVSDEAAPAVRQLCDQLIAARDAIAANQLPDVEGTVKKIEETYAQVRGFYQPIVEVSSKP